MITLRDGLTLALAGAALALLASASGALAPQDSAPHDAGSYTTHARQAGAVGFERMTTPDGIEVGVWYPSDGSPQTIPLGPYSQSVVPGGPVVGSGLALVVISHGNGGGFTSHVDTAQALARAGFVVAALTHPGDNWQDQSKATAMDLRPRALQRVITYMLEIWPGHDQIDAGRVGAFGFSSGGFTVLAAAGGKPDFRRMAAHCKQHPGFYDCKLIAAHALPSAPDWRGVRDARIKALVVAAPALGFTFGKKGLDGVRVPVQLWRADDDHILPAPDYADAVRRDLPQPPDFESVAGAGHFDFLAPCNGPMTIPAICTSSEGFDRAAFHLRFNAALVAFFKRSLE